MNSFSNEFLDEFSGFVKARETGQKGILPQFIILRLPDDHTAGATPGMPTPSASIADKAVWEVTERVRDENLEWARAG